MRTARAGLQDLQQLRPLRLARRALRGVQARLEASGLFGSRRPPEAQPGVDRGWLAASPRTESAPYAAAAQRIAEGWLEVLALRNVELGHPPRWNRDPRTGIEAPLVHGKLLDCADPDLVGDIHHLWDVNRHRHLVTLAQGFALSGRRAFAEALAEHVESWILACPERRGANWASGREAGVRLANWALAWQIVYGAPCVSAPAEGLLQGLRARWLSSIYQHAEFILAWMSPDEAGNDLVAEAAGLYLAGLTWPHWNAAQNWKRTGRTMLERAILQQHTADGVNRAHSTSWQRFVLELALLAMVAARGRGERLSAACEARIEAMLDFMVSIMDAVGNVPVLGDEAGRALQLAPHEDNVHRTLLGIGAVLFERGDFKQRAGELPEAARWLLDAATQARYAALDCARTRLPLRQTFSESGYHVLGCELGRPEEIRLVATAGAATPPAQGHADLLSFTLGAGGLELLVDAGGYVDYAREPWRYYFRGTAAHNTVRIDGVDQIVASEHGTRRAPAGCSLWLSSAAKDCFEGWHHGYRRLQDPVSHRRYLELDKAARRLLIEDALQMAGEHEVELFFHFHESCALSRAEDGFLVRREDRTLRLVLPALDGAQIELHRGSLTPAAGWLARGARRVPASTLVWRARLAGTRVLRSLMEIT